MSVDVRYGWLAKLLHWLIFILVLTLLIVGFTMDGISNKILEHFVSNLHKITGICVLFLMLFRAVWMKTHPKPPSLPATPLWQKYVERGVHLLIYLALIAMPLAGWVMSTAKGKAPHLFNWVIALPGIPQNKSLSQWGYNIHNFLAYIIIALISLHILAAFYHHFIKRDETLRRMI